MTVSLATGLAVCVMMLGGAACGSRTGLLGRDELPPDFGLPDARGDTRGDAREAGLRDRDASLPPIDATARPDVDQRDCPDPSTTFIYVVTNSNQLVAYNPRANAFRVVGSLVCPAVGTPFSMAVDRRGIAYVLYNDGNLFRVSTLTGACAPTPFRTGQQGFQLFGMGFASNSGGPEETLFVAGDNRDGAQQGLARIDLTTFALTRVGQGELPTRAELTGSGDGRLFAFYPGDVAGSAIGQVDKTRGLITAENPLAVEQGNGWAFAFWGGDFYTFTGRGQGSDVTRYQPLTNTEELVTTYPETIVGAGVSTCAPAE
jgi:hypothetical protein